MEGRGQDRVARVRMDIVIGGLGWACLPIVLPMLSSAVMPAPLRGYCNTTPFLCLMGHNLPEQALLQ